MEYAFYRLEKTKIAFEQHRLIDSKICQSSINYLKFHAISRVVYCIWDYGSVVNYNTAYSKVAHKYFLKVFYNKTNKKEYKSQIWQYNVLHIIIIVMKDVIMLEKAIKKEKLLKSSADRIASAKVAQALSSVDLA